MQYRVNIWYYLTRPRQRCQPNGEIVERRTAEWITGQITEEFPWNEAPRYLIRDRDQIYDAAVMRRLRTMGIRD